MAVKLDVGDQVWFWDRRPFAKYASRKFAVVRKIRESGWLDVQSDDIIRVMPPDKVYRDRKGKGTT